MAGLVPIRPAAHNLRLYPSIRERINRNWSYPAFRTPDLR